MVKYNETFREVRTITDKEVIGAVHNSMYRQWEKRGYATPVDTLMDCGVLSKKAYEEWRFGKVPYLEKACTVNLRKLSFIMHQMRAFAKKNEQGHKPVIPLRFSKSGDAEIEKWYATHFVDAEKVEQLKTKA